MASTQQATKHFSALIIFILSSTVLAAFLFLIHFWPTPFCLLSPTPAFTPDSNLANQLVQFSEHADYQNLSHSYDALWDSTLPSNGGFVLRYVENGTQHEYGLSMYHSLHCLIMIRSAIQGLYDEIERSNGEEKMASDHSYYHGGHGDPVHWLHCFDYLRQTILYAADGTMEPPKKNSHGKENVDGMIERKCRDPRLLWKLSVDSYEVEEMLED
ncbi:hypothetical protein ACMFMG_007098 [Clarireedia jacksonii]